MSRSLAVGIVVLGLGAMTAQVAARGTPKPCSDPEYHQFDFFVGDWIATQQDATPAGTNLVTVEEGGCLLRENWQGGGGTNGESLNFYQSTPKASGPLTAHLDSLKGRAEVSDSFPAHRWTGSNRALKCRRYGACSVNRYPRTSCRRFHTFSTASTT